MNAITVNNIHKKFKVYYDKGRTFKEKILFQNRNHYEDRWVLNGVSFEIKKGEAVGLIGENGCGKSTLLKLMSRIIYPDNGSIKINGRVSSLIELGAGFHPDMSGKENIYTNASIFGLTKKEIDTRLNDIIAFSELEEFIDNPVRTYSSGMYMRLAFSVAINVDADVLLIDEILAVGDVSFQAKCFNRLREIKANGTTIVIVSHSLTQIEQICDRSIWIDAGVIRMEAKPRDVHPYYLEFMGKKNNVVENKNDEIDNFEIEYNDEIETIENLLDEEQINIEDGENNQNNENIEDNKNTEETIKVKNRWGNQDARILKVRLYDKDKKEKETYKTGEDLIIEISYETYKKIENPVIGIGIFRNDDINCYGTNTNVDRIEGVALKSKGKIICYIKKNNLISGEYKLDIAIQTRDGFDCDYYKDARLFRMYSDIEDIGVARLDHKWEFD